MKLLQAIRKKFPQHKYSINVALLGDYSECAWSNLGFWNENNKNTYPQACENLANHLAQSLNLNSKDVLLDLGCGYGASLIFWKEKYLIENIQAVELQESCIEIIKKQNIKNTSVFCDSYLNLKFIPFQNKFDVILCLDSAYHHTLNLFLDSVTLVLNSKGRVGFHTLMLSDKWETLNALQQKKYAWLLKAADVNLKVLNSKKDLEKSLNEFKFKKIKVEDLSQPVLLGFSNYVEKELECNKKGIDFFKIKMTAKLCKKLFDDGVVCYVQVTAEYE